MPRLGNLSECPLCFGRLLPLSACLSCNSVVVRDRLDGVGPQIACEDCGATNPTHFVCSACNARFPYAEIAKDEGLTCPACRTPIRPGLAECPNGHAVLASQGTATARLRRRVQGEYGDADVHEVARLTGLPRQKAEILCAAGYTAPWKLARATEEELARVRGIGARAASRIRESLRSSLPGERPSTEAEVLSERCECPVCGTITSLFATHCRDCGAAFDVAELDEELRRSLVADEVVRLLGFYDDLLHRTREDSDVQYARGILLLAACRPAEALASLDKVLERRPDDRRTLQAKARALGSVKGTGAAAQVLRLLVPEAGPEIVSQRASLPARPPRPEGEDEALAALGGLAEADQAAHEEIEEERLLDELERAVAGDVKAPPPPLKPEIPPEVVDRKRWMLAFLLRLPGVSRRAAESSSGFFQDLDQIAASDTADLAGIFGVAPAEARLIKQAVDKYFASPPQAPPARVLRTVPSPPPPLPPEPMTRPVQPPSPPPPPEPSARPPPVAEAGRRGLVNGHGLVNGRGRVNGLINGTGFVTGGAIAEIRFPRRNLTPRYAAIGASLLMLFSIAAGIISEPPVPPIEVDGDVDDWAVARAPSYLMGTATDNPNATIRSSSVLYDSTYGLLFARVQVEGRAFADPSDYDSVYMFVDADGNSTTGYGIGAIGADNLARISGVGERVEDTRLQRFQASDQLNWNGWQPVGSVSAGARGSNVEVSVPVDMLDRFDAAEFRVVFAFDDNVRATSVTDVPIGPSRGSVRITQSVVAGTVAAAPGQQLLELQFEMIGEGPARVQRVNLRTNPPGIPFGSVRQDIVLQTGDVVREVVWVDATTLSQGASVSAGVASVEADRPHALAGVEARAYVLQPPPPSMKQIDGLFGDWPVPLPDAGDPTPADRRSLNILSRDGSVLGTEVFLYARMGGPALEGSPVPQRLQRPQTTSGTGGGGAPAPPPPPLVGYDYVRFYLDTNESEPGGFEASGLQADRYVEVRGREGQVGNASAYRWVGTGWRWDGRASTALGGQDIEVRVAIPTATFNVTRLVVTSADWRGVVDLTDPVVSRSGTKGGLGLVPLHGDSAQTAVAKPLANVPTVDGTCGTSSNEYQGADLRSNANVRFLLGSRGSNARLYVCVEVSADTDNDGASDWGELLFDRSHDGGTTPQADDRRFRVTSGSSSLTEQKGDGSGWVSCGGSCASGNSGSGAFNASTNQTYEFAISLWDVAGSNTTTSTVTVGFAIVAFDSSGSNTYPWGANNVDENSPNTWGHLEVPEFPQAVGVAAGIALLLVWVRRRRRDRDAAP